MLTSATSTASLASTGSSRRLSRKCTCVVETESDSEAESEQELLDGDAQGGDLVGAKAAAWTKSLSLLDLTRSTSGVRDPIKTSQALHNSEALRLAQALPNVFCACYDMETVLSTVQRRERGYSPIQRLLLEPESIAKVFEYATSVPESRRGHQDLRDRYHRAFLATEIILKFYLKAMAWHGEPRSDEQPESNNAPDVQDEKGVEHDEVEEEYEADTSMDEMQSLKPTFTLDDAKVLSIPPSRSAQPLAPALSFTGKFQRHGSANRKNFRLHVSMRLESMSSSFSDYDETDSGSELNANPVVRGFILRLDELSVTQWKRIFGGLFRCLWSDAATRSFKLNDESSGKSSGPLNGLKKSVDDSDTAMDSVLAAYLCRITKNLVIFPAVHRMICEIEGQSEGSRRKETVLERLAYHAYNPEVASLLHGLIHLAQRRDVSFDRAIRCIVRRAVDGMPTRPVRTLSSASSTSTSSSTSSPSPTSATSSLASPGLNFSASTAVFSSRRPIAHDRITGCVGILSKILAQEFPNTFQYYIQSRIQLSSFESVEPFERELFPPKMLPNDPKIHNDLKNVVLGALLENPDVIMRLAELGTMELRYLEANQANGEGVPTTLVIDTLRLVIECSLDNSQRLDQLVAPVQTILESICASINYHQHLSTISEFAARACFSDSDSDDSAGEEDSDSSTSTEDRDEGSFSRVSAEILSSMQDEADFRMGSPALIRSPLGKTVIKHRPLTSTLLVLHVVELLDAIIRMSRDAIDTRLTRLELAKSLLDTFEKFPKANILHCRLLKLYLNLLDRQTTNGRMNNPLLRSVFRPPESILNFIMHKLRKSSMKHAYDPHLAILGVKIDKICGSPTLQQELIRQYCNSTDGWSDFVGTIVASHYQQMDALDESLFSMSAGDEVGANNRIRRISDDGLEEMIPFARPSSSASEYLSRELIPFRRLPMEKEGFGSAQNRASGQEMVHPTDMLRSRAKSQYPESIIDILRADSTTSFDPVEDDVSITGYAYQKRAKWVHVSLKFDKQTCELTIQDLASPSANMNGGMNSPSSKSNTKAASATKLKQFLLSSKQYWNNRPKKLVVIKSWKWIAFGRSVKNPEIGAFGFQVEVFDGHREVQESLTFVTGSDISRTRWFETMHSVAISRTSRQGSFSDADEAANITLVECVASNRQGLARHYSAVPDVNLLGPMIASNFILKSDVPEEIPFWGTYHGEHGVAKYVSLFNRCVQVVSVEEKRMHANGDMVIVEFDATFEPAGIDTGSEHGTGAKRSVRCACTDTYMISANEIIGLTRTIADSEKLVELLSDE